LLDRFKNALGVTRHVVVPETQDAPPLICKEGIASCVTRIFCVLTSVEFDDQSMLNGCEVGDEGADRHLATEFDSIQTPIAQ